MHSMYERVDQRADMFQHLLFILNGGQVRRFHTVPTLKDITVGHHSYTVAWLCYILAVDISCPQPEASLSLIMAALSHDLAEQVWGDMPSPAKRRRSDNETLTLEKQMLEQNRSAFELNNWERMLLKLADCMAGMLECVQERSMGNKLMELPYKRFRAYIFEPAKPLTEHHLKVLAAIDQLWDGSIGA